MMLMFREGIVLYYALQVVPLRWFSLVGFEAVFGQPLLPCYIL